ncbi:putative alpha-E superfamily protein [Fontibacillus solani]|uniref:Putative alpha-E superfamily protein n=1 Tax=Fontibacillus solani TaxID=1572857 RepID=A0A7W3XTJ9_9BACL|nr:alpha-E domain-containing protein [Fontibacillus solani]MBA9087649.1 putative alpha-E superfamily protein [Fontibacillus solani]
MLNRTAEALLWIGRYTERAENHVRLIDVLYHLRENEEDDECSVWHRLVNAVGNPEVYELKYGEYEEISALNHVIFDREQPNSLFSCISQARTNLRNIREKIPSELWEVMNGFFLWLKDSTVEQMLQQSPHLFFRRIKESLSTYQGMSQSILYRDEYYQWSECGRYLERCENTLRLLTAISDDRSGSHVAEHFSLRLQSVLQVAGGYEGFRRQNSDNVDPEAVAAFMITDGYFPRSIHFSVRMLKERLEAIQRGNSSRIKDTRLNKPLKLAGKMSSDLEMLDDSDLAPDRLGDALRGLSRSTEQIGVTISSLFFQEEREVIA